MIIGINGRMMAGKDSFAEIFAETYENVERVAFAAKLKESCAALFNISLGELEELKVEESVELVASWDGELDFFSFDYQPLNFRQLLQRYGTEAHREIFGDDFWIRQLLDNVIDAEKFVLVTDCRFPNEAQAIKNRGGLVIRIVRPDQDDHGNHHASEQNIDALVDYFVVNDGDLSKLRFEVEVFAEWLAGRGTFVTPKEVSV